MMRLSHPTIRAVILAVAALALCAASPKLLSAIPEDAACGPDEQGPALRVNVQGLKDARGVLRLELYPPVDGDFLQDDYLLVQAGKVFRRVVVAAPEADPVTMCIRAPEPGRYAVALIHARRNQQSFSPFVDGIGFGNSPKLSFSKPKARQATITIGPGVTDATIVVNYLNGLSIGPGHRH
jgi:uncharacterized protein (DUF2141 family)